VAWGAGRTWPSSENLAMHSAPWLGWNLCASASLSPLAASCCWSAVTSLLPATWQKKWQPSQISTTSSSITCFCASGIGSSSAAAVAAAAARASASCCSE
jgi:hypothetical protein